ncbi:MAG TPA: DUF4129 domain-containing protein [Terracidiphilus sp.]|nr:DUF4129 domain-containing protein [Terracidiphilus sp.]
MTLRSQLAGAALTAALAAGVCTLPARADEHAQQPPKNVREVSLAEYRQHLVELNEVVGTCARARDNKSCDPELTGTDDRVPLFNTQERRLVRYNWLRVLLWNARTKDEIPKAAQNHDGNKSQNKTDNSPEDKAKSEADGGAKEAPAEEFTRPLKPTTGELLLAAQLRLAQDLAQADSAAAGPPAAAPDYSQERNTMKQVLAGRDFRNLEAPTKSDSFLEKLGDWLNRLFESIGKLHANVDWMGPVIVWGFILATCVGLAWGLLQLERRWRIRLVPESDGPAAGAASARNWQLWIDDARRAAAAGQWREAIHFVYWAAISRLESKRLWPADRARTPREYLALVTANDPRRAGLATLTGSFERTWYGGRMAGESEYMQAEKLADRLISGSGAAEGGAR